MKKLLIILGILVALGAAFFIGIMWLCNQTS
jgi:hypothetical protein